MAENRQQVNVAIFASGAGTNAKNIIDYFRQNHFIKIALIVCNKRGAGVLQIAGEEKIPVLLIEKENFFSGDAYLNVLRKAEIGFIVLAGFLWKIPSVLISAYRGKIINIHPALLPLHGGKNMYGRNVHEAVLNSGSNESGITIHYVDEHYDSGDIVFQAMCHVDKNETVETLTEKIHLLEHKHYPAVIEGLIEKQFTS
jgi:phosphoribosylglycinamide formyltransferase-1